MPTFHNIAARIVAALLFLIAFTARGAARDNGVYVVVTDHLSRAEMRSGDISRALQHIIDTHPNRTILFPDGVYTISQPILTPADPSKSVSLRLEAYAIIRASNDWSSDEAMIRLGGKCKANNITQPGSNYFLDGGIIDCAGRAKAISIESGRETVVRNCSIKNTMLGLHIKHGANSGSSDCDIRDVNIVGCSNLHSVGVLVEGYDNTFTNMRIGGVHTGFILRSSANSLRNIHPLYYGKGGDYASSCGFVDMAGNNFYDFCYSDEFAVGFYINGRHSVYSNCFAYWYSKRGRKHVAIKSKGRFNAHVTYLNVGFGAHNRTDENKVLECDTEGGSGTIERLHIRDSRILTDHSHEAYLK